MIRTLYRSGQTVYAMGDWKPPLYLYRAYVRIAMMKPDPPNGWRFEFADEFNFNPVGVLVIDSAGNMGKVV